MEWSHSNIGTAAKVGLAFSAVALALAFALRDVNENVQVAVGLGVVIVAFVASMLATRRSPQSTHAAPSTHHQVSHIPLHSDAQVA